MSTTLVEGRIGSLDAFAAWQTARDEEQEAYDAAPPKIDSSNPEHLNAQLGYLAAHGEQRTARQLLMHDVASQDDDFLPLAYRLGVLAAFDITNTEPRVRHLGNGRSIGMGPDLFRLGHDRGEQGIRPSSDPLELATQIGQEIDRVSGLLDSRESVPVVMVWSHHFIPPRIDYDEVVIGELPNPRSAFVLEPPKVVEVDGQKVASYTIPVRLQGVKKGRVVRADEYVQPEDKYRNPLITTLARLGISSSSMADNPDALYIGYKEVEARVAQAERDQAEYERQMERLSRVPWHERRY